MGRMAGRQKKKDRAGEIKSDTSRENVDVMDPALSIGNGNAFAGLHGVLEQAISNFEMTSPSCTYTRMLLLLL